MKRNGEKLTRSLIVPSFFTTCRQGNSTSDALPEQKSASG
jgi:hypothetical protein